MKKNLLIILLFSSSFVFAQTIQSITTFPVNPAETDSVYILAHCVFTSASCDQHTDGFSISGNAFDAWALNCLGMLTTICYYTDTFSLGLLPAGNYVFNFQLDEGFGQTICTPGIVAGPDTSYSFTVSPSTSIDENTFRENIFSVYPNPVSDYLQIKFNQPKAKCKSTISLFTLCGTKVFEESIFSDKNEILLDIKKIKAGFYTIQLTTDDFISLQKIIKQ